MKRDTETVSRKPTLKEWVLLNLKIGTLSFGGASRIVLYQDEIVDRYQWLSRDEIQEILTIVQVLPGPNLVNFVAYLGSRLHSHLAALLGVLCLSIPGAFLIVAVALLPNENPIIEKIFRGLSIGSIILFSVFLYRLANGIKATLSTQTQISKSKTYLRYFLAAIIFAFSYLGTPVIPLIFCSSIVCIAVEFLL